MNARQELLIRAARHATEYLEHIDDRPVRATASGDDMRRALGGPFPETGEPERDVIDRLAEAARTGTVATQGPRFFGFVVGGSRPEATAADWLVSAWDQNAGLFVLSPLVSVAEAVVGDWLCQIAGLAGRWSVGFVTGCQMANFSALATARHHVLEAAGWDVEAQGLMGAPPVDVIVSDESHYTIFTSLRMLGFGANRVRRVPTDNQGRMRAGELSRMLAGGSGPCIIAAQAGNVNTGAFDPIAEIVPLARKRGAWLHVDGAFGFWAAASPVVARHVAGMSDADSIATDAHKWLNVPYDSGIVLTSHPEAHRAALTLGAAYILPSDAERDPHEFVPEESRRARSIPVYAVLRVLGRRGLRQLVDELCGLARRMAEALGNEPGVEVLNDVVLNQVLVRFVPPEGGDADAFTREVVTRVQQDGTCWLSGTTWHGMAAMRISVSNWSTKDVDIDRSAAAIITAVRTARGDGLRE